MWTASPPTGSVREALTEIEAAAPEAVTLDISLPDGSGVEVLKHSRRNVTLCRSRGKIRSRC